MVKQKYFALGIILSLMASTFILHSVSASMKGSKVVSANSFEAIAIEVDAKALVYLTASSDSNFDLYIVSSTEYNNNVVQGKVFYSLADDESATKNKEVEWENTGSMKVTVYLLLVNRGSSAITINYGIAILKTMVIPANDFGIIEIELNAGATIFAIFSSTSTFSAVLFDSQNYNAFAEAWNSQTGYGNVQYLARSLDVKQVEMEWSVNSAQTLYYVIYCQNILFPMVLYYAYSIEEADNSALYFLMFIAVVAIIVIVIVKKRKAAKTQKIQTQENQTQ